MIIDNIVRWELASPDDIKKFIIARYGAKFCIALRCFTLLCVTLRYFALHQGLSYTTYYSVLKVDINEVEKWEDV